MQTHTLLAYSCCKNWVWKISSFRNNLTVMGLIGVYVVGGFYKVGLMGCMCKLI